LSEFRPKRRSIRYRISHASLYATGVCLLVNRYSSGNRFFERIFVQTLLYNHTVWLDFRPRQYRGADTYCIQRLGGVQNAVELDGKSRRNRILSSVLLFSVESAFFQQFSAIEAREKKPAQNVVGFGGYCFV
jgi:hypothetical protein